jgi:hypothetical protein
MSLWTPGGEVPVNRESGGSAAGGGADGGAGSRGPRRSAGGDGAPSPRPALSEEVLAEAAAAAGIDLESLSADERAELESMMLEMAEAQTRLASTPAADVVLNHLGGLYELARIHLSQDPPHFDDAALAIDALAAALDAVGDRLGPDGVAFREALSQLQIQFLRLRERFEPADEG